MESHEQKNKKYSIYQQELERLKPQNNSEDAVRDFKAIPKNRTGLILVSVFLITLLIVSWFLRYELIFFILSASDRQYEGKDISFRVVDAQCCVNPYIWSDDEYGYVFVLEMTNISTTGRAVQPRFLFHANNGLQNIMDGESTEAIKGSFGRYETMSLFNDDDLGLADVLRIRIWPEESVHYVVFVSASERNESVRLYATLDGVEVYSEMFWFPEQAPAVEKQSIIARFTDGYFNTPPHISENIIHITAQELSDELEQDFFGTLERYDERAMIITGVLGMAKKLEHSENFRIGMRGLTYVKEDKEFYIQFFFNEGDPGFKINTKTAEYYWNHIDEPITIAGIFVPVYNNEVIQSVAISTCRFPQEMMVY